MPRIKSWIRVLTSLIVAGFGLTKRNGDPCMVSMSCLLSLPPRPRPDSSQPASHLQLHPASVVRGHMETNMASAALGSWTSNQFQNQV